MQGRKFFFKDILDLALPIIMGNLGFMLIGVGDVIVAGRHSTNTLAAISIAASITHCVMMLGIGILVTIPALLSNYRGEGKKAEQYFYPSLKYAAFISVITSCLLWAFVPFIKNFGFESELVPMIKDYLFITGFATFGAYLHAVTKEFLLAFEIVIFPNALSVFSIFLNVALNIILVFGFGPIPSLGVVGLAIASLVTRYFMGIVLLIYIFKKLKISYLKDWKYYIDLTKIGFPASMAIMIEFVGFNAITIIMGRVSGIYAAAHNILCTLTSVAFMIPLAFSNAGAVKIGFCNGAKQYNSLKHYAKTMLMMSVGFMLFSSLICALFPQFLAGLFTTDKDLINVCVPIIYTLCFFQVFDGTQVSLSGIFKGLRNTKIVMLSNFVSYWLIALPLGYYLAICKGQNLIGFWYALIISSVVVCSLMGAYLITKFKTMRN